jgi:GTP-binding protein Era
LSESSPATGEPVRSGTVALVGWTNVGKSTLLNRLVGQKLAAVAEVAQTTRAPIRGVCNVPGGHQLVLVDTPGLHRPRSRMNRGMVDRVRREIAAADVGVLVVDAARGAGAGDRRAAGLFRRTAAARLVVLNKIDRVRPRSRLLPLMRLAAEEWGVPEVVPLSAQSGEGCDLLLARLVELLPAGPPLHPPDYLTDQTERALAAEWIRERLVHATRQELPHASAVLIEAWREQADGTTEIHAAILVDRESHKPIVIGKAGRLLARVGREARGELERLLERRVVLRLWVKVRRDWRDDSRTLHELGL